MPITGVKRNASFAKLGAGYLFPIIKAKRSKYLEENPKANIISLGVGDTTEPLPQKVADAMAEYSKGLGTRAGYQGYDPPSEGKLKERIAAEMYPGLGIKPNEVIITDGSKCDIGRLQILFGNETKVAITDPAYPCYVDTSVIFGRTGELDEKTKQYKGINYLDCNASNDFFPDLKGVGDAGIIFFCSPNNPSGAAATKDQLKKLVDYAKANGKLIIYDSAYAAYISDSNCPKSIYEIEGAKECAIESTSFSKLAGFTGVRLGWMVCPDQIKYGCGTPVLNDLTRLINTIFNGAANVSQCGGLAVLDNMAEIKKTVAFYMENARLVRECCKECGIKYFGGVNAPYTFMHFPGRGSWEVFDEILANCQVVTTPGAGFGPSGDGFVRISAFGSREQIVEACGRIKKHFKK